MNKKVDEKTMSTFEATMRACQESKNKTQKKIIKESNKITEAAEDDIDAGIDDFDEFDDEVVDFDGNPLEGESLPEDTFDDVAVIIDPDLDPEDVSSNIDELQQLIDETPDGEVPTSDEYVGDFTYTCPICGNKFFNDTELAEGSECPVCGETPEAFILMGEVSKIDDTEDKEEEPKEDSETKEESTEEEVEEVEEIEESKKVEEGCSDKEDKKEDEEDKTEKKEESAQQLELDSKPVWTPPKRSDKRPKVTKVTKDNALKAERARRRARALRRARRMEQMRKNRRVRPSTRRRVENRRRPVSRGIQIINRANKLEARRRRLESTARPINRRPVSRRTVESRTSRRAGVRRPIERTRRVESRRPMNRRTFNRQFEQKRTNTRRATRVDEKSFNRLLTKFVTENYKNIESMEVSKARLSKGVLTLECILNKKDDSKVNTSIVIENFRFRDGYGRFTCDVDKVFSPKTESNTKNTFVVECKKIGSVVKCTSFRYNFITESKSGTYRVSGLCK